MYKKNNNEYNPNNPSHPGETLLELLQDKKMTQEQLSQKTSIPLSTINGIIDGEEGITISIAEQLAYTLVTSAKFWINMQNNYNKSLNKE